MSDIRTFAKSRFAGPATLSFEFLLFSNAVTAYFAITNDWSLISVLRVFWVQSVTIGILNFIRILRLKEFSVEGYKVNGKQADATRETKVFTAFFFLFHYGFFHLVYAAFLLDGSVSELSSGMPDPGVSGQMIFLSLLFLLSSLFSYAYAGTKDTKGQNIGTLMFYPYIRILPMHLMPFVAFGNPNALPIFLLLKTAADVGMQLVERRVLAKHVASG